MKREITRRETLLECLDLMKKLRNSFSVKGYGMTPIDRYAVLYQEYDEKCQIIREMIQAMESEPVRKALAGWQTEELPPTVLRFDEDAEERNEGRYTEADVHDHPEGKRVPGGDDPVLQGSEVVHLSDGRVEDKGRGESGGDRAGDGRDRDAVQSGGKPAAGDGHIVRPELEGGGGVWFYVCSECHATLMWKQIVCPGCHRVIDWREE